MSRASDQSRLCTAFWLVAWADLDRSLPREAALLKTCLVERAEAEDGFRFELQS